jgi:glycerol-3-phosphate dehydrogenase
MAVSDKTPIKTTVAVIGAGIVGCAIARELSKYKVDTLVIEKEADVGWGTTKANTGIIHPGYAGDRGTLRLSLCRRGHILFIKNAEELGIPILYSSSLLNVFKKDQIKIIEQLLEQGREYGVKDLRIILNKNGQLKKLEPNISDNVIASLYCGEYFATSPYESAIAISENAGKNGTNFLLSSKVESIYFDKTYKKFFIEVSNTSFHKINRKANIETKTALNKNKKTIEADYIINAAGVFADEIACMVGDNSFFITAIKGQYFLLDSDVKNLIRNHNIRMSDPENIRSKGMIVAMTIGGNFLIGSNYEATHKYDFSTTAKGLNEIKEKLSGMIINIPFDRVISTFCGLRAYANTGDFILGPSKANRRFINAAGIQSPGLTCAFIIAEIVIESLKEVGLILEKNQKFIPERKRIAKLNNQDFLDNKNLYNINKSYGEIICRCEKISEAEIIAAIRNGATTLDSIKFRTRAGMGRCQGGYCTLRVMKILSRELGIQFDGVTKSGGSSYLAMYKMN